MKPRIAVIGLKGLPAFGGAAAVGENIVEQLSGSLDITVYSTATHTSHQGSYKGIWQHTFRPFPIRKLNVVYYYVASALHAVIFGKYDLIHLHHMDAAFTLFILRLRYKVVSTSHGLTYRHAKWGRLVKPYFKLNEWIQVKFSNHLTVVAQSLVAHFSAMMPAEKLSYIPNGIAITKSEAIKPKQPVGYMLFAAGRIIPSKGLHILLEALQNAKHTGKLVVLGDYTQRPSYWQQLQRLSEGLDVEYIGLVKSKDEINGYIQGATVFVFPSTYEAMSMMLLEVAANKTPVICSDIMENRDVFSDEEMLFFRSGDAEDLKAKIALALGSESQMKNKALKAYDKLVKEYQWSDIAAKYERLFNQVING